MLQDYYLVAKIGVDTAENEPSKVARFSTSSSRLSGPREAHGDEARGPRSPRGDPREDEEVPGRGPPLGGFL